MKKIGLLLPKSTYYTTIGFDIFEGVKSNLKKLGLEDLKIITENIGFGGEKQVCYRAAEKLLLDENVTLVVAYIGHRMAELLRPLFLAANKILIVLDAGANMPQEWSVCPNIIYHSLHNSLGAFLSSKLAIKKGYKTGGMITGYYDGGYLHTYSLSKNFENEGGKICFNHATGYKKEDFSMDPLKTHLETFPDAALLTLFSGDFVQWYFEKLKVLYNDVNIPIFLTPFSFEETVLKNTICPSSNIYGIAAWSINLENTENIEFKEAIETSGKTPNLFSLLGWESAELIKKTLSILESNNNILKVIQELNGFKFKSPRGIITFYSKYNQTIAPLYESSIFPDENGNCLVKIDAIIENTENYFDDLYNLELNNVTSAWYNSYVCI